MDYFQIMLFIVTCWKFQKIQQPYINSLRPRQDGRHFADDIFMCIFFNENCCILIKFSLKYVRKGPIDNNPALVEIMAWRRSGDKPLSQPMIVSLPTHICVTRPQWVKRYFYVFFSTNIVEIFLKLRADASSGSGAVKAFLQGSSSPSPSPSSSSSLLFSIFA